MTTKATKAKPARWRLYAKPGRAPSWWPRKCGRAAWVGVLRGGEGWTVEPGDWLTRAELVIARREVELPGDRRARRFRVVPDATAAAA
jgi:hypothetical protein